MPWYLLFYTAPIYCTCRAHCCGPDAFEDVCTCTRLHALGAWTVVLVWHVPTSLPRPWPGRQQGGDALAQVTDIPGEPPQVLPHMLPL